MQQSLRALVAILPALALAVGTLVLWENRLSTPNAVYSWFPSGDLYGYFLPSYTYQALRFAEWEIPLWNPYQGVGQPFLATLQPGVMYPARLLLVVLRPERAMQASLCVHLVFLVVTTYAFARALGATRLAASGAAVVLGATLGGNWFYWPSYLEAGAWWPTLALALLRVVGGAGWGWAVLLGVSGAMPVLAGGYQMTVYMAYALLLLAAGLFADSRFRPERWGIVALRLGVAGLIATATAAPQLLPTLAWSSEAARRAALMTDLQLDPFAFMHSPWQLVSRTLLDGSNAREIYLSLPAAALALLGFARQRALGLVMGGGALVLYGVALGPDSPLFALYRVLPGLGLYRIPSRLVISVFFLLAAGVALGLDACQRWRPPWFPRLGSAAAAVALALMFAALVIPLRNLTQVPWLQAGPLRASLPLLKLAAPWVGDGRVAFFGSLGPTHPRFPMLHAMRCVQDYEPLASRRLQQYLYAVAGEPAPTSDAPFPFTGTVDGANPLARPRLLDLVATSVVVVTHPAEAVLEGLRLVATFRLSAIYANPRALPRAYTVPRARFVASEGAALVAIQAANFDPRREAVLVGSATDETGRAVAAGDGGGLAAARILRDAAERVEVAVDVKATAVLVLADAFAPGWEAVVDGRPRRLWQANHLVRGVVVEP
ncbi:MAG: hypothetical protein ACREI8_05650, partial [Myxococcota bacterium]